MKFKIITLAIILILFRSTYAENFFGVRIDAPIDSVDCTYLFTDTSNPIPLMNIDHLRLRIKYKVDTAFTADTITISLVTTWVKDYKTTTDGWFSAPTIGDTLMDGVATGYLWDSTEYIYSRLLKDTAADGSSLYGDYLFVITEYHFTMNDLAADSELVGSTYGINIKSEALIDRK